MPADAGFNAARRVRLVHEIKHDGYRLIARREGNLVRLWSCHGTDFAAMLTRIAKAIGALPVENVLLDGKAVALLDDGHSDFEALGTTAGAARATLVAFDLLHIRQARPSPECA